MASCVPNASTIYTHQALTLSPHPDPSPATKSEYLHTTRDISCFEVAREQGTRIYPHSPSRLVSVLGIRDYDCGVRYIVSILLPTWMNPGLRPSPSQLSNSRSKGCVIGPSESRALWRQVYKEAICDQSPPLIPSLSFHPSQPARFLKRSYVLRHIGT